MKTVDEVYPFNINTTIGPTGTIKRLFRNRDYFVKRGYEMTIFALNNTPNNKGRVALSEIDTLPKQSDTQTIQTPNLERSIVPNKHSLVVNYYLLSAISYYRSIWINRKYIKQYISKNRTPDIVVFHEMESCLHYLKNRRENNAKVVLFLHNDGSDGKMFAKRFPKLSGKREHRKMLDDLFFCYKYCDRIVWISKLANNRFCGNHPEYSHKSFAVVNGIDDMPVINICASSPYKYRLVSTGTVCERKGQYIIVEALHRIDKAVLEQTHLTIIGSGPDYGRLVSLTEEYGLSDHISFTGNISNNDVPRYLAVENIYILMSNNEGLPISILEAMRVGLPIISTNVAGIPEEVDERNGFLIDPDIEQLTNLLNKLPNYDWNDLSRASRKRFEEEFTFERMMDDYIKMFDSINRT